MNDEILFRDWLAEHRGAVLRVWESVVASALMGSFVLTVNAWVYWINQRAVRTTLEPRRQELAAMLPSLSAEPSG